MSVSIFRQYTDSPRSFAKARILEMNLKRSTFLNNLRLSIHYVSSCLIARDRNWLKYKWMALIVAPLGVILTVYIFKKSQINANDNG